MLVRPTVSRAGSVSGRDAGPGDIISLGDYIGAGPSADAAATITAAMIAVGIVNRTGTTAGRTDTTDTADNVLAALSGNDFDRNVLAGNTFRFKYIQNQAFLITWAHGRGWVAGALAGTLNVAASTWRSFVCKILCAAKEVAVANCTVHNGTKAIELATPQPAGTIVPGMMLTSAGNITAGTKIVGVTYGDSTNRINTDKICAITTDTNSIADAAGQSITFSPVIEISSEGSGTL